MPNQFGELAVIHSPWHALLPTATALARLMRGEMDHALAIVPLKAAEFAVLLELRGPPFQEGAPAGARTERELAAGLLQTASTTEGAPAGARTERELATGLLLTAGTTEEARAGARTKRELATGLLLTAGTTNELVSRLEERGLIARAAAQGCRSGKRGRPQMTVALTGEGATVLRAAAKIARRVEDDWASRLAGGPGGPGGAAGAGVRDDLRYLRAYGLKRWLTESLTALSRR